MSFLQGIGIRIRTGSAKYAGTDDTVYINAADPDWEVAVTGVSALKAVWLASLDPDS